MKENIKIYGYIARKAVDNKSIAVRRGEGMYFGGTKDILNKHRKNRSDKTKLNLRFFLKNFKKFQGMLKQVKFYLRNEMTNQKIEVKNGTSKEGRMWQGILIRSFNPQLNRNHGTQFYQRQCATDGTVWHKSHTDKDFVLHGIDEFTLSEFFFDIASVVLFRDIDIQKGSDNFYQEGKISRPVKINHKADGHFIIEAHTQSLGEL